MTLASAEGAAQSGTSPAQARPDSADGGETRHERQHVGYPRASHSAWLLASRFNRNNGSVFEGRRLNHHVPRSTVRPSRWSSVAPRFAYAASTRSITAVGDATFVLISPDPTYRSNGLRSSDIRASGPASR